MILSALVNSFPTLKPNFDLDDCDHVLRVEGNEFTPTKIIDLLQVIDPTINSKKRNLREVS